MASQSIKRDAIIQSTLFHIQLKRCQYIDDFPEAVADVFEKNVYRGRLKKYQDLKRKLYRISTSFFDVNKGIKKKDFFESLYNRIKRRVN
jgi:serine/threonine-protein kinase RIO1